MGVGSALRCQGWGFLSLALGALGCQGWRGHGGGQKGTGCPGEGVTQGLEGRNWAHGGHRRAGVCRDGTEQRVEGWHWGWWRDSGDMGGFLRGRGEDKAMLGVAEGRGGVSRVAEADGALGSPKGASGVSSVPVPCGPPC